MDVHPRDLPIAQTYDIADEGGAQAAIDAMVEAGFEGVKGYRVLMPKDQRTAKRIGYMVTTGVVHGLRQLDKPRDVRYWTYHHDESHYAIVLIGAAAVSGL